MGEVAEMMMDGTLCEQCGVYLEGGGEGFPQMCGSCANDAKADGQVVRDTGLGTWQNVTPVNRPGVKVPCPICSKRVKFSGLEAHQMAVHGKTKALSAKQLRKISLDDRPQPDAGARSTADILAEFDAFIRKHDISITYSNDDDGVHVSIGDQECFVGSIYGGLKAV